MRDDRYPITSTFSNPIYSDGAFIVLGRVLERMTNLSYSDAVRTLIAEPLGLEDTSTLVPERMELDAVALPGDETVSSWNLDSQLNAP